MKAIRVHRFGGPDVLALEDVEAPRATSGTVVVRVRAAGVNPADTYMRSGSYGVKPPLPYTPGSDAAGVVEAVGDGVSSAKVGDRVYTARTLSGAYAELALCEASRVHPLPEAVTFAQGASLFVPYGTALHALLHFARARAGETVLVHGASGGVGVATVQAARAMGLRVLGTAGTEAGRALARREGAHEVFDHHDPAYREAIARSTGGLGLDVVVEMLANENLGHDLRLLARRGRVVVVGSRGEATINARDLMGRDGAVFALSLWNVEPDDERELHAAIAAGLENRTLRPVVGKELPLAEAARAHELVMAPGAHGKVVLLP